MGRRGKGMAKKTPTTPVNIISELPESLIETILTHLPIQDAARTSILSKKWRYKWTCLPKLVFDDTLLPKQQSQRTTKDLLYTIYKILLQRTRPTLDFCLSITSLESCADVGLLLTYLSMNHVEKLTLSFWKGEYKLPSSLFSCLGLTHLDLTACAFEPPLTFKGFSCLTSVNFDDVSFNAKTFGRFLLSCPVLESLTLTECTSVSFEISAPKLKILFLEGDIDSICFNNVPLLSQVSIYPESEVEILKKGRVSGLIKFFKSLPALENLEMNYHLFKSLVAGDSVPEKLPATLVGLTNLHLVDISFGSLEGVIFVLCMIRSSPQLQSLKIELCSSVSDLGVEAVISEECVDLSLNQLKRVCIQGVTGTLAELKFIKLLVAKSPVLECAMVEPVSEDAGNNVEILKSVVRFKRASTNAEIIFL